MVDKFSNEKSLFKNLKWNFTIFTYNLPFHMSYIIFEYIVCNYRCGNELFFGVSYVYILYIKRDKVSQVSTIQIAL